MKKFLVLGFLVLTNIPFVSSARSGYEMYLVDGMTCKGVLTTNNPDMHDDYKKMDMTFTSMKSTRRDGSLADVLVIETSFSSDIYTSPLYVKKNRVRKELGMFDGRVELEIISSETKNGVRTDTLTGTFSEEGTVVGDRSYDLQCTANVVKEVSRIDDMTNRSWLKVLPKNRELSKRIAAEEKEEYIVSELLDKGESYKVRDLKGDAKKVYDAADREFRDVESITVESWKVTLIHVSDAPEGNGCEYLFNLEGEYLNRSCGTESSEWEWQEK